MKKVNVVFLLTGDSFCYCCMKFGQCISEDSCYICPEGTYMP